MQHNMFYIASVRVCLYRRYIEFVCSFNIKREVGKPSLPVSVEDELDDVVAEGE